MQVLSENIPGVKTEAADVHSLLHARVHGNGHGNGHARVNGGNGRHHRVRHQIHNNRRRAALQADSAIVLVEAAGMAVTEAVERCSTTSAYFHAMKALRESGNVGLYNAVLRGDEPVLASARRVKNAAAAITAYEKCSPLERELFWVATGATADAVTLLRNLRADQLVAASKTLGLDWVWDQMISAAMSTEASA
jgi:hypothetical protein